MMKKVIALLLTVCMLMVATSTAFAYSFGTDCVTDYASSFGASSWSSIDIGDPYVSADVTLNLYVNGSYFGSAYDKNSSFALAEIWEPGTAKIIRAEGIHKFYRSDDTFDSFVSADSK